MVQPRRRRLYAALVTLAAIALGWGLPCLAQTRVGVLDLTRTKVEAAAIAARWTQAIRSAVKNLPQLELVAGKNLDEIKLVFGCVNEAPACMSDVASDLGARKLLWGAVEPVGENRYRLTLHVLDAEARRVERKLSLVLEDGGTSASPELERMVAQLLGMDEGVLRLGVPIAGASILVDGRLVGKSEASVPWFEQRQRVGDHALEVRKAGYVSWRRTVQISPGKVTQLMVSMSMAAVAVPQPSLVAERSSLGWRIAFWSSAAIALGAGLALIPNGLKVGSLQDDKREEIDRLIADPSLSAEDAELIARMGCSAPNAPASLRDICSQGRRHATLQNVLIGTGVGFGALTAFLAYKVFWSRSSRQTDAASVASESTGHGVDRRWRLEPTVGPDGAGLGLQLQFD